MSAIKSLVNYSSDSDECSEQENPTLKKIKLENCVEHNRLPLPSIFALKKENNEHIDDSDKHSGRIRTFAHERGNWSTYVYIPYFANEKFLDVVHCLHNECNSIGTFHILQEYHLSVSKTFVLRFHWINTFVSSLRDSLRDFSKFFIYCQNVDIYTNDDQSRTFVAFQVSVGVENLINVVQRVDRVAEEFGLPSFYDNPSFHISVLWCLGDKRKELKQILPSLQNILCGELESLDNNPFLEIDVEYLNCKTGNKIFKIDL